MPTTKKTSTIKRVTVSLPEPLLGDLDTIAALLGLTRSATLSSLLENTLRITRTSLFPALLEAKHDIEGGVALEAVTKRYCASAKDLIDSEVASLLGGGSSDDDK